MIHSMAAKKSRMLLSSMVLAGLGLAVSAGAWPAAAQQNPPDQASQVQDAAAPPDSLPQGQLEVQAQAQTQGQPNQAVPPQTLTLPAGTVIRVRTDEWISTDRNVVGDSFSATLDQPIVVGGWVVARRGQAQTGRVFLVKKSGHGGGASELGIDLPELTLVDGQQLPLQTQLFQTSAGTSHGQDAAIIGTTTGVGAAIGAIAGRGVGAAIGAGIGATAGIIGVISTAGKPTEIPPETVLSFRLQAPVTISTANSQLAFQPVTQSDYDSHSAEGRPHMARRVPPPLYYPYPYPYAYAYPYPYWYPSPFFNFGYYGGFGRFGGFRR
ncbi:MAG TPA: hypothetical protein VEW69_10895 [Alphaproteobacteria bacterium]|nr:hypothetical protein [Alphaproteobacteria bacterium]